MNQKTLQHIAEHLNAANFRWAIGGSLLLAQYGLTETVNDLDIIVHKEEAVSMAEHLRRIGRESETTSTRPFLTSYYYTFHVDETAVDVMGNFKISHENGVYTLTFTERSTSMHMINGTPLPFCKLEDWFILYQLMPGREEKVRKIEDYLLTNGSDAPDLLVAALDQELPDPVTQRIYQVLR